MHLAARVALEVMQASGERTEERLRWLVEAYAKTYGIVGEAVDPLQADALQAALRIFDFQRSQSSAQAVTLDGLRQQSAIRPL